MGLIWRVNPAIIEDEMKRAAAEAARKGAYKAQSRVRSNIMAKNRIDTTRMFGQITVQPMGFAWYKVKSPQFYSVYQEWGVKPFGPKRAKYLRFKPKGSSSYVFAKRVRGFPPGHFFKDAVKAANVNDFI